MTAQAVLKYPAFVWDVRWNIGSHYINTSHDSTSCTEVSSICVGCEMEHWKSLHQHKSWQHKLHWSIQHLCGMWDGTLEVTTSTQVMTAQAALKYPAFVWDVRWNIGSHYINTSHDSTSCTEVSSICVGCEMEHWKSLHQHKSWQPKLHWSIQHLCGMWDGTTQVTPATQVMTAQAALTYPAFVWDVRWNIGSHYINTSHDSTSCTEVSSICVGCEMEHWKSLHQHKSWQHKLYWSIQHLCGMWDGTLEVTTSTQVMTAQAALKYPAFVWDVRWNNASHSSNTSHDSPSRSTEVSIIVCDAGLVTNVCADITALTGLPLHGAWDRTTQVTVLKYVTVRGIRWNSASQITEVLTTGWGVKQSLYSCMSECGVYNKPVQVRSLKYWPLYGVTDRTAQITVLKYML